MAIEEDDFGNASILDEILEIIEMDCSIYRRHFLDIDRNWFPDSGNRFVHYFHIVRAMKVRNSDCRSCALGLA